MRNMSRIATLRTVPAWMTVVLAVVWLGCVPNLNLDAHPQASLQAVTDQITYNAGDQVLLRVIFPSPQVEQTQAGYRFDVRYEEEERPVAGGLVLGEARSSAGYRRLWKLPLDARTGRYVIDLRGQDDESRQVIPDIRHIASFVVHRQVVRIVSADVQEPYYTSGDTVGCRVKIENLGNHRLSGLRLEFSERYWPWIVQQREQVGTEIEKLQSGITLKPHAITSVDAPHCAVAKKVDQPTIKQYAAVVWDHDRKNVYAIAFTPLVFVNPPGKVTPRPYPPQFVYPSLEVVNTTSYRQFHPEPYGAGAIQFETEHTMFASGSEAKVRFSLTNPTDAAWRQVTAHARLLSPDGKEMANHTMVERADLDPHGPALKQEVSFSLPPKGVDSIASGCKSPMTRDAPLPRASSSSASTRFLNLWWYSARTKTTMEPRWASFAPWRRIRFPFTSFISPAAMRALATGTFSILADRPRR